jgi:hypothetical protein
VLRAINSSESFGISSFNLSHYLSLRAFQNHFAEVYFSSPSSQKKRERNWILYKLVESRLNLKLDMVRKTFPFYELLWILMRIVLPRMMMAYKHQFIELAMLLKCCLGFR